jgi:ankyrin repeat protein
MFECHYMCNDFRFLSNYRTQNGNLGLVELLSDRGADVNAVSPSGVTPLLISVRCGACDWL